MKKYFIFLFSLTIFFSNIVLAKESNPHKGVRWSYSEKSDGPLKWGTLSHDYAICKDGRNQSPINLSNMIDAKLPAIEFKYRVSSVSIINNGHTIQYNYDKGSFIVYEGIKYELKQIHFHSPSEHKINGKSYPLEAHLVHSDKNGNLAVIGVPFKDGKTNLFVYALWSNLPPIEGKEHKAKKMILNAMDLIPVSRDYYRYNGSLTTPPCSEGVRWFVMSDGMEISKEQVSKLVSLIGENARPVQGHNARAVLK